MTRLPQANTPTQTATTAPITASPTSSISPTPSRSPNYDLNDDGRVDIKDLLIVIQYDRGKNLRGDFSGDGYIDSIDVFLFSKYWETSVVP